MNEICEKGKPGPHHWLADSMVNGITHAICRGCGETKAYDTKGNSVPVTKAMVIPQTQPPHNITEHNQEYISGKYREYRKREHEIKEALKSHESVAAAAQALEIPVTSIRTMLIRWKLKKVGNELVPRTDLRKKRSSPKQRFHEIEENKEELISIYLREQRDGGTDYQAAKAMGMSASTLVGVKLRWKEDIEKAEMNTNAGPNQSDTDEVAAIILKRMQGAVDHGLDVYTEIADFHIYWDGVKVGLGVEEIPER